MKTVTKISDLKPLVRFYCPHYKEHLTFMKRTTSGINGDSPLYHFASNGIRMSGGWKWVRSLRLTRD